MPSVTRASSPNKVQPLDDVDRAIVSALREDARLTNRALAEMVGIAASTCLNRVRALTESGVLKGFHADVELSALDLNVRAVIAVRLRPDARTRIGSFAATLAEHPAVQHLYFLGGAEDFLVDVVAHDTVALRDYVVHQLSENPDVAATETNIVFDFVPGRGGL